MKSADLKAFRAFLGVTQQELADMLDVSRNSVDNWENRKDPPHWVPNALGSVLTEYYKMKERNAPWPGGSSSS